MPTVSVIILTKDRAELLRRALASVLKQTYADLEVIVVNDGSKDNSAVALREYQSGLPLRVIQHAVSQGITKSRQEALEVSAGDCIAILDDDDEWVAADKLKKQVEFLDGHPDYVLVGGGISVGRKQASRPKTDKQIRATMLLRNNFFTSTVMFRRQAAVEAGGFIKDADDLAEDYDLWLRLGKKGKMYNFQEVFTAYRQPSYNKERFRRFLAKQLRLAGSHSGDYPYAPLAVIILNLRILFGI